MKNNKKLKDISLNNVNYELIKNIYEAYWIIYLPFTSDDKKIKKDIKNWSKEIQTIVNFFKEKNYIINNPLIFVWMKKAEKEKMLELIEKLFNEYKFTWFYLRKWFWKSTNLNDEKYTTEDWNTILAQYSLTYWWNDYYESIFWNEPKEVIKNYYRDVDLTDVFKIQQWAKVIKFVDNLWLLNIIISSLRKNSVMSNAEKFVFFNLPLNWLNIIEKAVNKIIDEIKINENLAVLLTWFIFNKYTYWKIYWINSYQDILNEINTKLYDSNNILVTSYMLNDLNQWIEKENEEFWRVRKVRKLKLKKYEWMVLKSLLEKILKWKSKTKEIKNILRKKDNWKIFYNSLFNPSSKRKTEKTKFKLLADIIFNKEVYRKEKPIEKQIDYYIFNEMNLEKAFELIYKTKNTWKFIRNIKTFLRYSLENKFSNWKKPKKSIKSNIFSFTTDFFNFEKNKNKIIKLLENFDNIRLLIQLKQVVKFIPENNEIYVRKVQWVRVKYYEDAPYFWIDWQLKEKVLDILEEVIESKIEEKIKNVKVFVTEEIKEKIKWIMLNFSSREVTTQLWKIYVENWSYLPLNFLYELEWANVIEENVKESKEKVERLLEKTNENNQLVDEFFNFDNTKQKEKENNVLENDEFIKDWIKNLKVRDENWEKLYLRIWIMWKSKNWISNDLDLSAWFINYSENKIDNIWYSNPELSKNWKVISISSWDVTNSNENKFSTEFIDIDLEEATKNWYDLIMWYVNDYSWKASTQDNYIFIQIVNEKNRITAWNVINIDVDKLLFATKIEIENSTWTIPYIINLNTKTLMVTSITQPKYRNIEEFISGNYLNDVKNLLNEIIEETNNKWVRLWNLINKWLTEKKEDANFILDIKDWDSNTINVLNLEWINKFKENLF